MPKVLKAVSMNKCLGCFACMHICAVVNQSNHSLTKSAIRIRTTGGMTTNFIAVVCVGCEDPVCSGICPTDALQIRPGGGVLLCTERCIGCRRCSRTCTMRAINFDEETHKPIICRHCGICATYCPHDCIQMIDTQEVVNDAL